MQQAATAASSIFERSALLSNFLSAKAFVKYGAQDSSVGWFSASNSIATAHDFGHLSALALASEKVTFKVDAKFGDEQIHSGPVGRIDGTKPCITASSSSADLIHGLAHAFADEAGSSQIMPGWVHGAPPQRSSLSTMSLCPPRRQEPFLLPKLARPIMRTTLPLGLLKCQGLL